MNHPMDRQVASPGVTGVAGSTGMSLSVVLLGWDRPEPQMAGVTWSHLRVGELRRRLSLDCHVVVLADYALEHLEPERLKLRLDGRSTRALLVVDRSNARTLVRWIQHGFSDVVFPEELLPRLADLRVAAWRPDIGLADWLEQVPAQGSDAWRAVNAVAELRRPFSVDEWTAHLGWSRQTLWRVCRSRLKAPPKTVLGWYVRSVIDRGLQRGMSQASLARLLGYSEPAALSRLVRERAD